MLRYASTLPVDRGHRPMREGWCSAVGRPISKQQLFRS